MINSDPVNSSGPCENTDHMMNHVVMTHTDMEDRQMVEKKDNQSFYYKLL